MTDQSISGDCREHTNQWIKNKWLRLLIALLLIAFVIGLGFLARK